MAYNEYLGDRVRQSLKDFKVPFSEKNMMGGLCFLVDDKMCLGIVGDKLMARIGPDAMEDARELPGCKEMDFTGRPMKGYVFVEPIGIDTDKQLNHWVKLGLEFNPQAKSSKKKASQS